jgi:two-component system CheB/CheR fusion protein
LVVDDDPDTVGTMELWLCLSGHDIRTARSGPEALAVAAAYRPDAVLLDVAMPGMDGWEVTRRLRQDPALRGVYIVCVSGLARQADRQRSVDAGCDDHWAKPIAPGQLEKLLESLRRKASREGG